MLHWCITVVPIPVVKNALRGVIAIFSYRKFDEAWIPEHVCQPELTFWTVSGPSHANKTETFLISTKMDHACCRAPLSSMKHPSQRSVGLRVNKTKEAGGIHPGYPYNTWLPVPLCQSKYTPHPAQHFTTTSDLMKPSSFTIIEQKKRCYNSYGYI